MLGLLLVGLSAAGCFFGPVTLQGQVLDKATQAPVPGAIVTVAGRVVDAPDGSFVFRGLPEGQLAIRVEAPGYQPYTDTIEVHAGDVAERSILLDPVDQPSPPDDPEPEPDPDPEPEPDPDPGDPPTPPQPKPATLTLRVVERVSPYGYSLRQFSVRAGGRTYNGVGGQVWMDGLKEGSLQIEVRSRYFATLRTTLELRAGAQQQTAVLWPVFTGPDLEVLARLVVAEAGSEPYEGQVAVAASVFNRVNSPDYPNTLPGVMYERWQYEPVGTGYIWQVWPTARSWNAVIDALTGYDPSWGATGFYNPDKTSDQWVRSRPVTTRIGNHVFFR